MTRQEDKPVDSSMWDELEQKYAINEALQWADDNFHAAMDEDSYYILYLFKFLYLCTLYFFKPDRNRHLRHWKICPR